jgi:hypothetical protein
VFWPAARGGQYDVETQIGFGELRVVGDEALQGAGDADALGRVLSELRILYTAPSEA